MWRNTVLWELRESGRLVGVERPIGQRSADDREILAFARERNAMICSNDRYEAGAYTRPLIGSFRALSMG
jgi:hypothetical protein